MASFPSNLPMIKNPSVAQSSFSKRFRPDDGVSNNEYNQNYAYRPNELNNTNYSYGYGYASSTDLNARITENRILLFTILNPKYNITVDVIHTICSKIAKVLRIVIFRKNGVQAMVEFDSIETAERIKSRLNGADIYAGCCTLNIEFARTQRLTVPHNDQNMWDYTIQDNSHLPDDFQKAPLLQTPEMQNFKRKYQDDHYNTSNDSYTMINSRSRGAYHYDPPASQHLRSNTQNYSSRNRNIPRNDYNDNSFTHTNSNNQSGYYLHNYHVVVIVYGLDQDIFNCDKLFNLLCLYGNIDRIKYLQSKEGCAMVQISNSDSIVPMLPHLNTTYVFGKKLQCHVSKQDVLNPVQNPKTLKDGTPAFKDFTNSRNNRYSTPDSASKNNPIAPSNVLHWFNAPPDTTEDEIENVFVKAGAKAPVKIKVFPKKSENHKSLTGLVEWNNVSDCSEALVLANHSEMSHNSSKFPYILKLCYSAAPIIDNTTEKNH